MFFSHRIWEKNWRKKFSLTTVFFSSNILFDKPLTKMFVLLLLLPRVKGIHRRTVPIWKKNWCKQLVTRGKINNKFTLPKRTIGKVNESIFFNCRNNLLNLSEFMWIIDKYATHSIYYAFKIHDIILVIKMEV